MYVEKSILISTEDFVILELESRTYLVTTLKSLIQVSSGFPKLFDSTTMSFFCEHITVFIFYNAIHPTCTEKQYMHSLTNSIFYPSIVLLNMYMFYESIIQIIRNFKSGLINVHICNPLDYMHTFSETKLALTSKDTI